jgi:methyl-accepting chemotaxis protein
MRYPLRLKILTGFLSVFLLLFISSMLSMSQARKNGATIRTISDTTLPDALVFTDIQVDTLKIQQWMSYAAATGDSLGSEKAQEYYEKALKALNTVIKAHEAEGGAGLRPRLVALRAELDDFMDLGMQMVEAYLGLGKDIGNTLMERFNPSADAISEAMAALVAEKDGGMKGEFSALLSRFELSLYVSFGALAVSALLSFFIAMGLSGSISRTIGKILSLTVDMREGDLTGEVSITTNDELGTLVANLNSAIASMKALVDSVKARAAENVEETKNLSSMIDKTLSASSSISDGSEEIGKKFDSLVEAISGSVTSIEKIFANVTALTGQVSRQTDAVSQTSASIDEISASLRNVDRVIAGKRELSNDLRSITLSGGEKVEATNEFIRDISEKAETILDLIGMIKGISSQTNLLAMNASIEAAHAGDFGKGFSVVADEIRKLAETTGDSAIQVSASLEQLVADIGSALESSRESGEAFTSIDEKVLLVVSAFDEISGNTVELAAGSEGITNSMIELISLTKAINAGSLEIEKETQAIERSLKEVEETSGGSRDDLREIDSQTNLVNRGITELSSLASKTNSDLELLNREIAAFKT